ncbi:MAG: tetraacyldisaccharide 4'-kinase [Gallionella sp.]|jgi:tetraacyldisaccharide 4'-kinase|nr:tetraacyldisaccharide 4'-kinase [Gallionella sp.]MCK9352869.1 tetraacyldisaccharide 4'-kinase [Gallionella sp.]
MSGLERHWYRLTPLHLILIPLSLIFRLLAALRRALYRAGLLHSERLPVPVVVVGNINVGGAGKTPLTLALAQQLIEQGKHPLIVSRGHGGDSVQPRAVMPDSDPVQVGDEPLLMARRGICPVWIGKDRAATARAGLQAHPQCDVVLCDDGLQHYRLQRDVEIAVIDGMRGFGNGWLLPAGPLREPVSRLRTVDAVVVNGGAVSPGQFAMQLEGALFHNQLDPSLTVGASHFIATKNHAVAGIGNPQRYFSHLEALGIRHTPHPFPDHHPYRAVDLAFADCDAILLTEKDAVKCAPFADARYWMLRVEARIDPALIAHILRKIAPHGR